VNRTSSGCSFLGLKIPPLAQGSKLKHARDTNGSGPGTFALLKRSSAMASICFCRFSSRMKSVIVLPRSWSDSLQKENKLTHLFVSKLSIVFRTHRKPFEHLPVWFPRKRNEVLEAVSRHHFPLKQRANELAFSYLCQKRFTHTVVVYYVTFLKHLKLTPPISAGAAGADWGRLLLTTRF
jgi:hypothetical protein